MGEAISKSDLARRFGVSPSSVTRWIQSGRLKPDANGRIPSAEVERLTAELHTYTEQHAARLAAIEGLVVQLADRRGDLIREGVRVAQDFIRVATAWHDGAPAEANTELADDLRARLATLGAIAEGVDTLEAMFELLPGILPPTPRRTLLALALQRGHDPELAVKTILAMSESDAAEKLREFSDFSNNPPAPAAAKQEEP
jgi:transcriptional regulator with XRE-family HTH domain